ncbi:nucleotidyltransferase domain-containing protein [Dehalococcoidia bacterium]|nr:nucleotidyltransferase domain-containing protein [Dehalococcoidia bacterium]
MKSHKEGNLKYFEVVKEFPFYPELKKIVYTTIGLGDYLTNRLENSDSIELAFIYGSVARNEERDKSDIDLFVVGEIEEEELHVLVSDIEREIGREINYTLMAKNEFLQRSERGEPFIKRILGEKKFVLKGSLGKAQTGVSLLPIILCYKLAEPICFTSDTGLLAARHTKLLSKFTGNTDSDVSNSLLAAGLSAAEKETSPAADLT